MELAFLFFALIGLAIAFVAMRMIVRRICGAIDKPSILGAIALLLVAALLVTPLGMFIQFAVGWFEGVEENRRNLPRPSAPAATDNSK